MPKNLRNGRTSTNASIEDEIAHLPESTLRRCGLRCERGVHRMSMYLY